MEYIKHQISEEVAQKIIGNQANALAYLVELNKLKPIEGLKIRTVGSGPRAGEQVLAMPSAAVWKMVVDTWDYELSKRVIRELFKQTAKYRRGQQAYDLMSEYMSQWQELNLGSIAWPFSQGDFDGFVQRVNSSATTSAEAKDDETKLAAVKYRRIKEINTVRNDFIETMIFEKNENILPTLSHRRGVDFFVDGVSFDQKVSKSPTTEFKRDYGENWRQTAIEHPELVAKYLYVNQDEGRFGADARLLV
ncbi:MAG TPA: hypothetical protein VHD84_03105, partial [Candidatus Saccharimonadales bacterium]|nr:hypothetical protein [Candidatus Saccharimonadales bacterium]